MTPNLRVGSIAAHPRISRYDAAVQPVSVATPSCCCCCCLIAGAATLTFAAVEVNQQRRRHGGSLWAVPLAIVALPAAIFASLNGRLEDGYGLPLFFVIGAGFYVVAHLVAGARSVLRPILTFLLLVAVGLLLIIADIVVLFSGEYWPLVMLVAAPAAGWVGWFIAKAVVPDPPQMPPPPHSEVRTPGLPTS